MCVCVWKICATINGYFFWVPNQHRMKNPKQTFLMQKTLKTPCIKKVHEQTQKCQIKNYENNAWTYNLPAALLVWKNDFMNKTQECIWIHGCSWVFMAAHGCSWVFICFCLAVYSLYVFAPPPFFWAEQIGIEMDVLEWLFNLGRDWQ